MVRSCFTDTRNTLQKSKIKKTDAKSYLYNQKMGALKRTYYKSKNPFGLEIKGSNEYNREKYNRKEKITEIGLGWYDYGARMYDPFIGRWSVVDPMASEFPHQSPYCAFDNDPINQIDPTGMAASPIYDQKGTLLGTDDQGLTGNAIVMDKKDFKQGMKHEDALKSSLGVGGLKDDAAKKNFVTSYSSLPNRPDYDGYLTKPEADNWWKDKSGKPLYVDQSKIELSDITTKDFNNKNGASFYKNFIWGLSNTGKVYGTLKLTLTNVNTGSVFLGGQNYLDEYDYKMDGRVVRNFATWYGRPGAANSGKDFFIYGYGEAKVPVKK